MKDEKLKTIYNLFQEKEIRSIWDSSKEDYYFSVVDVIAALTDSSNPRDYWHRLKIRMSEEEKCELSTKCRQLKMKAQYGKLRETDTLEWIEVRIKAIIGRKKLTNTWKENLRDNMTVVEVAITNIG